MQIHIPTLFSNTYGWTVVGNHLQLKIIQLLCQLLETLDCIQYSVRTWQDSRAEQCVPYISLDKSLIIKMLLPTYLHDSAKNRVVVHSAAIPSSMSELILALLNARLCTLANELHMVLIQLAEFLLSLGKPC